jgi:hypothetical protein
MDADSLDLECLLKLQNLAQEMLDDGDSYVEDYGWRLADLLRLVASPSS